MSGAPQSLVGSGLIEMMVELSSNAPPGCIVEVGVYHGGSAWHLAKVAKEQGREIHLFDTFSGIPCAEPEDNHVVGDFNDADLDAVMVAIPDAKFHVGVFPETMPADMPPIAFAHIDCDQYASVKASIEHLGPLMVPGGIMHFDDYTCTRGATRAVNEAFPEDRIVPTTAGRGLVRF